MAQSKVGLFNLALSACGSSASVSSETENSREAELCSLWYETSRDVVQGAAPWATVRRYQRLALRQERVGDQWAPSDPAPAFRYAYATPAGMLQPYHLESFSRFEYSSYSGGRQISCDEDAPILYYNARVEDISQWETGLYIATFHDLAFRIAKALTGRDSTVQMNFELARDQINSMLVMAMNSEHKPVEHLPDWLAIRGYSEPNQTRFVYPFPTYAYGSSS